MRSEGTFEHVEILGPRASLDRWLEVLQDQGGCHFVDALVGLEGEPGIGRPRISIDERDAARLRSEAARSLRAVERVVPRRGAPRGGPERPAFTVGRHGEGRDEFERTVKEAKDAGGRLLRVLEGGREADRRLEEADAARLLLEALGDEPDATDEVRAYALRGGAAQRGAGRLERRLVGAGARVSKARSDRQVVLACRAPEHLDEALDRLAHEAGAHRLTLPAPTEGDRAARRQEVDRAHAEAERMDTAALEGLRKAVDAEGERVRFLLDALDDAEAREGVLDRLAATEHVVAARAWVPREALPELRRALEGRMGREVLVRVLPPAADAPALPRAVAPVPFAAFEGMRRVRFGEFTAPALLALALPLAFGLAWSDVAGGLILLLGGALLGVGATPASPRKDTALLAQFAGLLALLGGLFFGRALGPIGASWFGDAWGWLGRGAPIESWRVLVLLLGAAALLLGLRGLLAALFHAREGGTTRARAAVAVSLHLFVAAGVSAGLFPPTSPLRHLFWLAPLAALVLLSVSGLREGWGRLLLDLLAFFRLFAIAAAALAVSAPAFAWLLEPSAVAIGLGVVSLLVAPLATVVDAAHVAMGVPYDLSLGGRALAPPFEPLRRRSGRRR